MKPLSFTIIQGNWGVMHYARKNSPRENCYLHFGQNVWDKTGFSHPHFHFQTKSKYQVLSNQSFPVHPIHMYNEFKFNVIYSMHSSEGIHSFCRKQRFLRDYLTVDQHNRGCIWPNLTFIKFYTELKRLDNGLFAIENIYRK